MNLQGWQSVQEVFFRAVDLSAGMSETERRSAILSLCEGDEELCTEVLAMVEEDRRENPLLDAGLKGAAGAVLDFGALPTLVEKQIGPYKLVRLLGEGGMGVVYLADRTDIGGQVAIKLLRDAWLSPMRRRRFLLEELTLARLNHPSIARIYDAGTLEDGTPWFVMEFAEGVPLTLYREKFGGTLRDVLRLFERVCAAVEFAHSHAIIHRDLKPSNIIVDENGAVKLLDFGIAKHLNETERNRESTMTGLRLLTLMYAAPEQLSGGVAGLYTDVYALGVVLYELIAERLPYRVQAGDETDAVERWASEKPSAVVRRERPATCNQLSRNEWTDLDLIVLKAMERDSARRYSSADSLLRDVTALLRGTPIEARRSDWAYIASKFVHRNKRLLMTAAAALTAIAASIGIYTMRLERARDAAQRQAARAERMEQFTENLFQGGDAAAGPAADLSVVALLERGRTEAAGLAGDPEAQADIEATLGGIYQKLGRLDAADPLLNAALARERQVLGPGDPKTARSLAAVSLLRKDQGRVAEAEDMAWQALATARSARSATPQDVADALLALGTILEVRGKYPQAQGSLEEALRLAGTGDASKRAHILVELANVQFYQGHYDVSRSLNEQALALNRRLYGEEHPAVADGLNNLGAIAMNRGDYPAAEGYYREAVAISEKWYGADHPETAANLTALAQVMTSEKRFDEATAMLQRALAIQQHQPGPVRATVGTTLNQLGVVAFQQDRYDEAKHYFLLAMDTWRKLYGDQHPFIANAVSNLGSICLAQKDYTCAEQKFREAVQRFDAISPQSFSAAVAQVKLGRTLLRAGRFVEAEAQTQPGYYYLKAHVMPDDNYLRAAEKDLTAIHEGMGKAATPAPEHPPRPATSKKPSVSSQ
jgi:serine/threonine-protein kinase